ncbi:ECF transporter S component [Ruminococcus albus]|uniref:Energy-coupling factor transport system substrate-specific component n=1 Tax=Ruminococcus albus TaxID=1264 RepID=A0A1I1I410_RUMAL|nr:ECF transporter S component [Ruminococcus albus]SFC30916.1 energy-coupling factor transport system substrate-specific component [Ruminococcus albus]
MKRVMKAAVLAVCMAIIAGGCLLFGERSASWLAGSAAVVICGVFFTRFEKKETTAGEIALAAVMTALSVTGRIIFAPLPAFKPCAAVIILAGIYLGAEQGFLVGALTALVSNFFFTQGIWTPFQMMIWGLTGLLAGLLGSRLKKNQIVLCIFGALAGLCYSVFMDICSVLWLGGGFTPERFLGLTLASAWFTVSYMVSNCVFLLIFLKPAERIFERLDSKFGLGAGARRE